MRPLCFLSLRVLLWIALFDHDCSLADSLLLLRFVASLRSDKDSEFDEVKSQDGASQVHTMFRLLGHFGAVALLRVHCLLGDYVSGLKALDPIEVSLVGSISVSVVP